MTLQNKNLYDPIEYMIRKMHAQKPGYGNPGERIDFEGPADLIREGGFLRQVIGPDWLIQLTYNSKRILDKVVGTCNNGYRIEVTLIYTNGLLTRYEPIEFFGESFEPDTNNWDDPVIL